MNYHQNVSCTDLFLLRSDPLSMILDIMFPRKNEYVFISAQTPFTTAESLLSYGESGIFFGEAEFNFGETNSMKLFLSNQN